MIDVPHDIEPARHLRERRPERALDPPQQRMQDLKHSKALHDDSAGAHNIGSRRRAPDDGAKERGEVCFPLGGRGEERAEERGGRGGPVEVEEVDEGLDEDVPPRRRRRCVVRDEIELDRWRRSWAASSAL